MARKSFYHTYRANDSERRFVEISPRKVPLMACSSRRRPTEEAGSCAGLVADGGCGSVAEGSAADIRAGRLLLGRGGIDISRLCLGLGSSGGGGPSVQARLREAKVADFLQAGYAAGATWWDTSDDYGTHAHVREALRQFGQDSIQITTKSHATGATQLRHRLNTSLRELGRETIDVFLLHEVDSLDDLERRAGAVAELGCLRAEGKARAVGLSTHNIDVVERVSGDRRFDVLMTNYNVAGVHMDADAAHYERALRRAASAGQGVVVMKTLGEGALAVSRYEEALLHNLRLDFAHGVVVGVKSIHEVRRACSVWQAFRLGS